MDGWTDPISIAPTAKYFDLEETDGWTDPMSIPPNAKYLDIPSLSV